MTDMNREIVDVDDEPRIDVQRYADAANVVTELTRMQANIRNEIMPGQPREMGVFAVLGAASELDVSEETRTMVYDLLLQSYAAGAAEAIAQEHGTLLVIPMEMITTEGET